MEETINYEFKAGRKYSRRMSLRVFPDGRVVITKPKLVSESVASQFADRKLPWIRKRLDYFKNTQFYDWKNHVPVDMSAALEFVKSKIDFYNQHYKFDIGTIRVKNHKSVWGTCSRRKNLNFNAKIVALPEEQANYIIVHELCHLQEFNHSKNFWKLVAETIPDYKRIKKDLRAYSYY